MKGCVFNEIPLGGRRFRPVICDPLQNLLFGNLRRLFDAPGNAGNHVGHCIASGGDGLQHLLICRGATSPKTMMAVDAHANNEPGVRGGAKVDARRRIFVGQIHIDVRMQRSLSSTPGTILGAVARGAVGAEERIESGFKGP
jgi:hypothetical protein